MKDKITLWISAGKCNDEYIKWLHAEVDQAENIKNRVHRESILTAFKFIEQALSSPIPDNGIVLYADSMGITCYKPQVPLRQSLYECGTDHITYREELTDITAIISMDNDEGAVAAINGKNIIFIEDTCSGVGGKSGKGGQSQRRYERNRERELLEYYNRIADKAKALLDYKPTNLILSGPALTKRKVYELLDYRLKQLPMRYLDIGYAGHTGIYQTINQLKED